MHAAELPAHLIDSSCIVFDTSRIMWLPVRISNTPCSIMFAAETPACNISNTACTTVDTSCIMYAAEPALHIGDTVCEVCIQGTDTVSDAVLVMVLSCCIYDVLGIITMR